MEERRHTLYAKVRFQTRWVIQVVLGTFILINATLIVSFLFGHYLATPGGRLVLGIFVILLEAVGVFFLYRHALRHSNRIAGPVYRIGKSAEDLEAGDLTTGVRVRQGDFFQSEVDALNSAIESLRRQIVSLKADAESGGDAEARLSRVRQGLSRFRT